MLQKIYIMLLMVSIISITGCSEDFLETKPTNAIAAADALSSPANMELVLNGLHRQLFAQSPLPGGSNSRAGNHYFIPMFDVLTGGMIHSAPGNGWFRAELRWTTHNDATTLTVEQFWYQRYHFIASTSAIINAIEEQGLVIDADLSNVLGQCYAYRAWAYHQLVSTYAKGYLIGNPASDAGIPLLLGSEAPFESGPRVSVQTIYDQVNADIDQSIVYFQDASAPDNKSHLSINAAYGIKARIALQSGDWATAATAAENARVGYPLMDEGEWLDGFNTYDYPEVIWGGRVIDSETTYYRSYFYLIGNTFNGSQNRGNPKIFDYEMYDKYADTDFRQKSIFPLAPNTNSSANNGEGGSYLTDPNYDNADDFWDAWGAITSVYSTGGHNTHPYMHQKFKQKNIGTIDPDDIIYMRSAEMYLIEAEAKAMQNDVSGAQTALDALIGTRDTAYDASQFTSKEDLMEEIKVQRYLELYGEGFGWFDHIRWDKGIDLTNSGASEVYYQDGFKQDKPSINDAWIWKLPQAEIDANPFLTEADQN